MIVSIPSFKDTTLPYCWKTVNVLPIFKKGCTSNPTNYRPMSLTSTCCRAMERIINNDIIAKQRAGLMRKFNSRFSYETRVTFQHNFTKMSHVNII